MSGEKNNCVDADTDTKNMYSSLLDHMRQITPNDARFQVNESEVCMVAKLAVDSARADLEAMKYFLDSRNITGVYNEGEGLQGEQCADGNINKCATANERYDALLESYKENSLNEITRSARDYAEQVGHGLSGSEKSVSSEIRR